MLISAPPSEVGGVNATLNCPSPARITPKVGAPGGTAVTVPLTATVCVVPPPPLTVISPV